jgi:flagellar motor switch protein FliM
LSNENARALTAIFETFARRLASSLDAYLGTGLEVKLKSLDQSPIKEHIAGITPLSYIVPLALSTGSSTMIVQCDLGIAFPIIELLLGGTGMSISDPRELSEIEEEILQDVTSLVARQCEQSWRFPHLSLTASRRTKPSLLAQYCAPNEKLTLAKFEIEIAGMTGLLQLLFPASFVSVLLNQIKADEPRRKTGLRYFPMPSIRERIVDCDFTLAASLPNLKVAVRDLIALQQGSVLKLRAPVRKPGMLTVEGQGIFEAAPVRNGSQKAAQLGSRIQRTSWEGE